MAIGRNFEQALMKAIRGAEISQYDLNRNSVQILSDAALRDKIRHQDDERIFAVYEALKRGRSIEELHAETMIDEWFLAKLTHIAEIEDRLIHEGYNDETYAEAKQYGFPDTVISRLTGARNVRHVPASFRMVDTCAAEFTASRAKRRLNI